MKAQENELVEQLKRIGRESKQSKIELEKLKAEVCKIIIGQSRFSEELITELINDKEKQILELNNRSNDLSGKIENLRKILQTEKQLNEDWQDWSVKFDLQEMNEKKSMIINLIEKIIVYDEKIGVRYRLKFDNYENNPYNIKRSQENDNTIEQGEFKQNTNGINENKVFLCHGFAQRETLAKI